MIKSMTGFGNSEAHIPQLGKVSVEIKSVNHRFLDVVCHLPNGFSYLEGKIKKQIEKKIKRGRITFQINLISAAKENFLINKQLLRKYYHQLNNLKRSLTIKQPLGLDTLIHLPGVLSVKQAQFRQKRIWPGLRSVVEAALAGLVETRAREGRALYSDLKQRNKELKNLADGIKKRFRQVIKEKLRQIPTPEEKAAFLKSSDITEEIVRMRFHIGNLRRKLNKSQAVGKELDFIAQELSRESNTMGAKSIDAVISSDVVAVKSQIEKIREQLQNVE